MLVFHWSDSSQKSLSSMRPQPAVSKSLNDRVNKHLQDLELKKSFNQMSAQLAWDQAQTDLADGLPLEEDEAQVVDIHVNDPSQKVYADLNPEEKGIRTVLPSERIQSRIAHKDWLKDYDHEVRREYVHAFVDNAQKDGYNVKINDKLEVVAVEKKRVIAPSMSLDQVIDKSASVPR